MGSKYHAKRVTIDGIKFDSATEGRYYQKYKQMEKDGEIKNLRLQVPYELVPAVYEEVEIVRHLKRGDKITKKKKLTQRPITYIADFVFEQNGKTCVVDVKGKRLPVYLLKKKMMKALKGIDIIEVYYAPERKKKKTPKGSLSLFCLLHQLYPGRTSHKSR